MKADEIFLAAVEKKTPGERAAFVDGACGENAELRAQVEGLLKSHDAAGSFLEQPLFDASPTVDPPAIAEGPSTVIGPYKLLQQIGEGGFGIVFMAEQTQPVRRKVALKVIKLGMDTRQVIARFEAERQALAMMDHVNIARVLDVGATGTGRPYFVMELVQGVPITKYCDDNHLTPRERLELFVPVCQAIQHAHQKGIIHRDIKPTNILVTMYDGKPVPKVIDFGVAKAIEQPLTERTMFTQYGTIVGTLEYMAPEQAEMSGLGVDTRSDIYALGVLLYELVTGSTPLERSRLREVAYSEVLRLIREEEAPKPSMRLSSSDTLPAIAAARKTEPAKLPKLVRGELDWIVMKALEKDRTRRYQTASGFAADVQHHMDDEAVEACPPSAWYRFRKLARRNKWPLITGTVVVGSLLAGTTVSISQAARATQALHAESAEHQRANQNLSRAVDAVEHFLIRVTRDERLLQADLHELRHDLLASAMPFYEEFVKQKQGDPELEWNRGRAFRDLTLLRSAMGDHVTAMGDCDQARAIFSELARVHSDDPRHRQYLALTINDQGNLLRDMGQLKEAEKAFQESLTIRKQLADDFPTEPRYLSELGSQYGNLGMALMYQRRFAEAEVALREGQAILKPVATDPSLGTADPSIALEARKGMATSHTNLGFLLYQQNDPKCEAEFLDAVRVYKSLFREFPRDPEYQRGLAVTYNHLGNFHRDSQQPEEAVAAYQETLKLYEPLVDRFPMVPNYRSELGGTLSNLGMLRLNQGQLAEAQELLERAIAHQRAAVKVNPRNAKYREFLSNHYALLADVLVRRGQHAAAADAAIGLADVRADNGEDAYDAAGFLAQCVTTAQNDQKLPKEKQDQLAQRYADQSINLLREAIKRGFKEVERFKKDKELNSLRMRPDFQELTKELEKQLPNRSGKKGEEPNKENQD